MDTHTGIIRLGRILTFGALALIFVPVVISILGSFSPAWHKGLFNGFTLKWYEYVFVNYGQTIGLSLLIAVNCVVINLALGTISGYALASRRFRGINLIEELMLLPIAIPGIAVALALIQTYPLIRGSWLFILIGHVIFTFPFMLNSMLSGMRSLGLKHLEEAAASLGAGWWFRFTRVILPSVWRSLINGMLLVFTISVGEFNLSFFLTTPLNTTLPVGLFESYASLRLEIASAYTVIYFIIIIPCLIAMQYFGKEGSFLRGNV